MTQKSYLIPAAALLLFAAACNESAPSAPSTKPPPPQILGTLTGEVNDSVMTAIFTPASGSISKFNGGFNAAKVSPAIYGQQGVTISVTGLLDSLVTVANVRRSWFFRVKMKNLLAYAVGSNYAQVAPPDTSGIFLFFTQPPVVSIPAGCLCSVIVNNPSATGSFTAPNQKYYWYRSRMSAAGTGGGKDTSTNNAEIEFKTTYFPPDTAHAFKFSLMVSAAWPPPNESSWNVLYDNVQDSLPDVNGKPRWRKFQITQDPNPGTATWTAAGQLVIATAGVNRSIFFSRNDSLGKKSATLRAVVKVGNAASTVTQAVIGLMEPLGGRRITIGLSGTRLGFDNFKNTNGQWSSSGVFGTSCTSAAGSCGAFTAYRTIEIRKYGTDSVAVCVDGKRRFGITYANLELVEGTWAPSSAIFGLSHGNGVQASWSSVSYTIGTAGNILPLTGTCL